MSPALPLLCALTRTLLAPTGPVREIASPDVPLPLQPFTVELLDLMRGRWEFADALGQYLTLAGPVTAFAYPEGATGDVRLAWLCCDPEFPEDLSHAVLRVTDASPEDGAFAIDEPFLAARVQVAPGATGAVRCTLTDIRLGPATTGDRYVAGLYVLVGEKACPLWLTPDAGAEHLGPRLLTDRVGSVFVGDEPVRVTLAASWLDGPAGHTVGLRAVDYATGEEVWSGEADLTGGPGLTTTALAIPLDRFGVSEVTATCAGGPAATLRVCRVPAPREVDPERSAIGINLFQQQIWWYAYQAPLMANAGVHWIRPWLAWENAWSTQEPKEGECDTRALDSSLRRMEALGQRYQAILWSAPSWLTGGTACGVPPEATMDAWAAYVEKLVARYRGRIRYWEVWNEPDLMWPEETRHSGAHYRAMLEATYAAAKRADPECVVLALSHAGYEEWLRNLGKLDAARWFDIATLHSYAPPATFPAEVAKRRALLEQGGMGDKPIWMNEFGSVAYDESPGYSAKYGCSERQQAGRLAALYAEALSLDPAMKAFWFCTYDPRDGAHESQWTGDAGIGVLYLGFAPKLSYAALAGTAREIDDRRCLGRADLTRDLHQVSFEGPVAVVWHDREERAEPLLATALGCLPGEWIVVRDLYTNQVSAGRAGETAIDLSHGPVYLEGSAQMAGVAACEAAFRLPQQALSVLPGATVTLDLEAPADVAATVTADPDFPASCTLEQGAVRISVPADAGRVFGTLRVSATFAAGTLSLAAPHTVERLLHVTTGAPNLARDGSFSRGDVSEWTPERTSPYAWDATVGCAAPGSLRIEGPFDRRLVHWNVTPATGRELRLRCQVRTEDLDGCLATLNVAAFGPEGWLGTWCLARTTPADGREPGWPTIEHPGAIPEGTVEWTLVDGALAPGPLPAGADRLALFLDASGGTGRLWLDDVDLYQP